MIMINLIKIEQYLFKKDLISVVKMTEKLLHT